MLKRILLSIAAVFLGGFLIATPVFAAGCTCPDGSEGVPTAILGENGCACDSGNGDSVIQLLDLIVDIMSIGIGILGVIGITIVGIQYLTAGGSEEKTRKAKRRMFEIVLGLVAYVLVYAALKWLLPEFGR